MSELHASSPVPEAQNGDHDEEERWQPPTQGRHVRKGTECPYLDTISRQVSHTCSRNIESMLCILGYTQSVTAAPQNLDFDFEKCCSVSLSPVNVYACLVCGKYFQVSTADALVPTKAVVCA